MTRTAATVTLPSCDRRGAAVLLELRPPRSTEASVHPLPLPSASPARRARAIGVLIDPCGADGGLRVRVEGELDLATAPRLESTLLCLVTARRHVVLDVGHVSFMDATGVALILRTAALARKLDGRFAVARRASAPVRRVLAVSGVEALVPWDA
jgi:anti-sigma B factor antagonist